MKKHPLLHLYNQGFDERVSWCTPSISPKVPYVKNIYKNDISVSCHKFGNLTSNTGVFNQAHKLAAKAYKAQHSLFVVNGSTGANFIVLRALKRQFGESLKILAQRNIHKSFCVACEDYQIDATYIRPEYDDRLRIFLPNKTEDIIAAIRKEQPNVFFITNPTYEGFSLDLKSLIKKIRLIKKDIIIYVDEAWGGHFCFSEKLPNSAMESNADICVQSTHKQASSLQQTSMIHWNEGTIKSKYILDSFKALTSTSPSYHLLASLDASRYFMEQHGSYEIDRLIDLAEFFKKEVNKIEGVSVWSSKEILQKFNKNVFSIDRTKLTLHLDSFSGIDLANLLEEKYNIIAEKYNAKNIFFIMTFNSSVSKVLKTVKAIKSIIENGNKKADIKKSLPEFPSALQAKIQAHEVWKKNSEIVLIEDAVGKIVAEDIVPYPTGIPLLIKGEIFLDEHLNYLKALRPLRDKVTILMHDQEIRKIKVVASE